MRRLRAARPVVAAAAAPAVAATAAPAAAQDAAFTQREAANFARTGQAPQQQVTDPTFLARWQQQSLANSLEFTTLGPARRLATSGNACREWAQQCTRGQGRSDNRTPDGEMGSNANSTVFATNTIDAIDFFQSTPEAPHEGNVAGDAREMTPVNPPHAVVNRGRLGAVGHSLGARGVSVVQGLQPRPGSGELAGLPVVPPVPAMGQAADYGLTPTPFRPPPDPDGKRAGFLACKDAGVPSYQLVVEGGTHYEWSLLPTFPTTAWEAPPAAPPPAAAPAARALPATGGTPALAGVLLVGAAAVVRRCRSTS